MVKNSEEYFYGQFTQEHLVSIKRGIELYNDEKFWECHEELEDLWLDDIGDNARYVYWTILQVATCLYHYREDNLLGAQGMIKKAKDKVFNCERKRVETPLLYQYLNWKEFKEKIKAIPEKGELKDFDKLFSFKFHPEPSQWRIEE